MIELNTQADTHCRSASHLHTPPRPVASCVSSASVTHSRADDATANLNIRSESGQHTQSGPEEELQLPASLPGTVEGRKKN